MGRGPSLRRTPRGHHWPEQKGLWGHGHQFPQAAADVLLLLLGWGLMVIALLPGARFWFDALSQLGSLR